jgi:hypothetical protein
MSQTFVGIDPDDGGAIAAIHPCGLVEFYDMPVVVTKTKRPRKRGSDPDAKPRFKTKIALDYDALAEIFARHEGSVFSTEYLWARPTRGQMSASDDGEGGASNATNFKGGLYTGAVLGILAAQKQNLYPPFSAAAWKKGVGAIGMAHEEYRQLALLLYPQCAHEMRLKKHHGRAAALLIAHYVKSKFPAEVAA